MRLTYVYPGAIIAVLALSACVPRPNLDESGKMRSGNAEVAFQGRIVQGIKEQPREAKGTAIEIAGRGKQCLAHIATNNEVRTDGAGGSTAFFGLAGQGSHTENIAGGSVISDADIANGMVTANSRIDYDSHMLQFNVRSIVSLEAKDGRFRLLRDNIQVAQKSTGYAANPGYKPLDSAVIGWDSAVSHMTAEDSRIADCISKATDDNW